MKSLFACPLLAVAALLTSCTTPGGGPVEKPVAAAVTNPLLGMWLFDATATASAVHNAVYAANTGLDEAQQQQTKKFIELSTGSTVTFTADTITTTVPGGKSESMKYTLKSVDDSGNVIIADASGTVATYSVSGYTLINNVPQFKFVAVYKKGSPRVVP